MKKLLLVTALVALTVLSASAFAQDVPVAEKSVQANEAGKRVKRHSELLVDNASTGGKGTGTKSNFDVPSGQGMVKVHVHNEGSSTMVVSVDKGNQSKNMTHYVEPGERWTGYSDRAFSTGNHTVQAYSPHGDSKGTVSVRVANTKKDLGP